MHTLSSTCPQHRRIICESESDFQVWIKTSDWDVSGCDVGSLLGRSLRLKTGCSASYISDALNSWAAPVKHCSRGDSLFVPLPRDGRGDGMRGRGGNRNRDKVVMLMDGGKQRTCRKREKKHYKNFLYLSECDGLFQLHHVMFSLQNRTLMRKTRTNKRKLHKRQDTDMKL